MRTEIIKITDLKTQASDITKAADLIRQGETVAFPTETVYGLGANGLDGEAASKIYCAKGRPSDNPLILHVADAFMIEQVALDIPPTAEKLLAAFTPGPLTLIMRRQSRVPAEITGGLDTVGVRLPENDIARSLIKAANVPIAAPSANLSGRPSPTTAKAVFKDLQGRIPLILDGGPCVFGVESTIVDCSDERAVILRPGAVTQEMLVEVLGEKVYIDPGLKNLKTIPKAPGLKYKHYAPKAPLTLIEGRAKKMPAAFRREIRRLKGEGKKVGIIASCEVTDFLLKNELISELLTQNYGRQGDLKSIAANIYEALRYFDEREVDCLLAEGTEEDGLGLAVMNRLRKASGYRSLCV